MEAKALFRLLLLSLLLLEITSQGDDKTRDAVLDVDGKPLRRGVQYLMLPTIASRGGGLTLSRMNGVCPPNVVQHSVMEKGDPVMFFPEQKREDSVVRASEGVYLLFPRLTPCPHSTAWRASGEFVTTGGTESFAYPNPSRFSISKSRTDRGYVIQSCPCPRFCRTPCSDVAVNMVNGKRLLTLGSSGYPYKVMFRKVREEELAAATSR